MNEQTPNEKVLEDLMRKVPFIRKEDDERIPRADAAADAVSVAGLEKDKSDPFDFKKNWNRLLADKLRESEDEVRSFAEKNIRFAHSNDPADQRAYEMGVRIREEYVEFMKKFVRRFSRE